MIPLKDENPTRTTPIVTLLLMAACIAVYFLVQPTGQTSFVDADAQDAQVREARFLLENAAIPNEITSGNPLDDAEVEGTFEVPSDVLCEPGGSDACYPDKSVWLSVLYSMFLHGGLLHLAGNMLFLWVFGNNIEDRRGRVTYIVFYVLAGIAATFAQVAIDPDSTIPMIGASGAIAGVMGAYLVLYPNVRIRTLILLGFILLFRDISAKWLLALWFISQFFIGPNSGVAAMAHIGGFVFGLVAGLVWRLASRGDSDSGHQVSYA
ncbi:MAG TPA: rhomboid family intramembrane serine protease [Acidimicrobiales bacterium]|nr:rhomboid family intramembrane serine protease [Acidimicrobiales bacterium]